mmetsp:Transcript_17669/g.36831  ORF Transcript_17669/g.36831 Transcript_17669/m.36831 type:complete len:107 (-) Transcript_17669:92-412(-)
MPRVNSRQLSCNLPDTSRQHTFSSGWVHEVLVSLSSPKRVKTAKQLAKGNDAAQLRHSSSIGLKCCDLDAGHGLLSLRLIQAPLDEFTRVARIIPDVCLWIHVLQV